MAPTQPQPSASQPQQPRRLTIRELQERQQERRRRIEEAISAIEILIDRWEEDEHLRARTRNGDEGPVEEMERAMAECMAVIRETRPTPSELPGLAGLMLSWAAFLVQAYRQHRAVPLLIEAIGLLKPPKDEYAAEGLAACASLLGETMRNLGRLDEAEAAYLDALEASKIVPRSPANADAHVELAAIYLELKRPEQALEHVLPVYQLLSGRSEYDEQLTSVLALLADIYDALGREDEYAECVNTLFILVDVFFEQGRHVAKETTIRCRMHLARSKLRDGELLEAERTLAPLMITYASVCEDNLMRGTDMRLIMDGLRLLAEALRASGKEADALRVEADLLETETIFQSFKDAALLELRAELRAELTAMMDGADDVAAGARPDTQPKKKKLSRKQQKRKAAQRRKAEARAVAAAEAAEATAQGEEEQEEIEAVAAALEEQQLEDAKPEPQPEPDKPEPEPEPEPEECAICLGDLPAAGTDGAVLLACSHSFHADCLGRWKDKCMEKGLRFTCAMCRGAVVVVVASGSGAGSAGEKSG